MKNNLLGGAGTAMAKIVLHKFDRFINILSFFLLISGGMIIHTLTSLTINSYYGTIWGYISFLLPVIAEFYLVFVQLGDNMYNYSILVAIFAIVALVIALLLIFKNIIRSKLELILERRASL